jgi:transposase-like protein
VAQPNGVRLPASLPDAIAYFSDADVANEYVVCWPVGLHCPCCGSSEHSYISTRRLWKCKACQRQFSVKVGTIFEPRLALVTRRRQSSPA